MVAVVSGNGLGLFNTSLTQLGTTWGGQAGIGQSRESQLVNIATGNLILQDQDENLAVRGFNTGLLRTYNSQGTVTGAGQDGFVTGYERNVALTGTLNAAGSTMTLNTGDGQTQVFTYTSTNVYTSTAGDGAHDTLTWASATSTWTLVEGSTRREEQYANHADAVLKGRLIRIRDLTSDSTTPAEFDVLYNANNLVSEVRSIDGAGASADAILFGYDTTFPTRLVAVATREGGVIKSQLWYEYDTYGRLSAVTTDLAPTTEASVLTARAGTDVWNATASLNNGSLFRTSYTYAAASATDLRIASVTQSDGTVVSYTYETNTPGARIKTVTLGDTNINDADGAGETVTFTYGTNTTDVTDSLGRVWTYKYDASKQLTEVDAPAISGLRDVTTYTYDAAGNVTQVKAVRGATVLSQMDYTYDANGNQTMQWDAAGNAVQRWFNLNTNQVTTENAYFNVDPDRTGPTAPTGAMTTRYIYDAQNRLRFTWSPLGEVTEYTYATSGNGIGQRASARMYLGATYTGGVFAETDLANWATTAQKTNSTLVEYTYDAKGRLSQTTSYASVDGTTGAGTFDTATDISRFTYDAHGMLLQQVSVRGASRTLTGTAPNGSEVIDYVYDGLGRLLSVLKRDMSRAPLTSRPDPVTNPAGYAAWDAVTQLTTYAYNDSGKQIVVTFDTADAVDATTGAIYTDRTRTQTQTFNAAHRLLSVADVGTTADLIANTSSTVTRTSQYYYDSAGQLRATQDAAGGRHYYFYDAKGLLAGDVDATGAVTEYTRDGAGRVIDTIGYSTRVDTSTWLSGSTVTQSDIAAIRPGWSTDFASLPITGLNTSQVDNPTYANVMQYQSASGRLAFITQYSATTINANIQRNPATLHALTENISYRGEISTGATQNNTYLLFSLQNTQPVGSTLRRTSIYFRNGNLYLNNQIGTVGSNTLIGATAANTTYVVEARTRDGVIEYTVYAKGTDPSTGWTVSTEADPADWGSIKLVVSGHAASDMTLGDALYLDNLSESDLGVRHNTRTYDSAGRLATSTDAAGTVTTYTYDGASRLLQTKTTDAAGTAATARTTRYFYDADNRQVATLDAAGYFSETIYDLGGRAIKTIRYATQSNSTYWASGTTGQLRPGVVASLDQTTRYYYNGRGQQVGVLNAEGYLTEYVYDEANNQRASKAYAKQLTGTDSDTLATLRTAATVTPPVPTEPFRLTQRTFNGLGQLIKELNAEGTLTVYSYDDAGRLVRTEAAQGTSEVREAFRRYDVFDQLIGELSGQQAADATTDPNPTFGLNGKLLNDASLTESQLNYAYSNYGLTHSYDLVGRRTESVDALGNKTWYFYDAQGRQTYLVRGVAQDNAGVTGVANSYGEVTETRYSAFGEVLDSIAYTGRIAIASPYDRNSVSTAIGALMFASASDTRRQYSYDTRGLLSRTIDAEGTVNRYAYTAFGQLDTEQRAFGTTAALTIDHTYDNRGLETSRVDAYGTALARTVSQTYDAFGRVISSTDGRRIANNSGATVTTTYDRLGRQLTQTRKVSVEGGTRTETTTRTYDAFDRVLALTDALGGTTNYAYSDTARSVTVTTPEGLVVSTVHNRFGQTVTATDGAGAITTYSYNKNGQLLQTTDALGRISTNEYDVHSGMLFATVDASGHRVELHYDAVGRVLTRVVDPGTGDLNLTTTYAYDGQGRQVTVTDANGDVSQVSYDQEGRTLQVTQDPSGLNLQTTYAYDALGRQVTVVEGAGTAAAQTTTYAYDALGRRISQTVDPGAGHLALTTSFVYDANDNLIKRTDANGNVTRYAYDEANRLTFTVDALGDVTRSSYDADGRLVATRAYATAITLTSGDITTLEAATAAAGSTLLAGKVTVDNTRDAVSYRVYDPDGRLRFAIDNLGDVTETTYDNAGRPIGSRSYANAITLDAAFRDKLIGKYVSGQSNAASTAIDNDVTAKLTADNSRDQQSLRVYDAAGELRYALTRTGVATYAVTEYRFDAAGRTIAEVAYATAIASSTAATTAAVAAAITAAGGDAAASQRLTSFVYDAAGRVRFTIDNVGAVSERIYDGVGRVVEERRYQTLIPTNTAATESAVLAALDAAEQALWNTDLSSLPTTATGLNTDMVGQYGNALTYDATNDRLVFQVINSATTAFPNVYRTQTHTPSENVVYGAELTTGASLSTTFFTFGVENNLTGADYRRTGFQITNGTLYKKELVGTTQLTTTLGTLAVNTTYTIEAHSREGGVDYFVYVKGTDKTTGFRFTVEETDKWDNIRLKMWSYTRPGTDGNPLYIDNLSETVAPSQHTSTRYDAAGRVLSVTDSLGNTESYTYNALGQRTSRTDKLGNVWTTVYDAAGRVQYTLDPLGTVQEQVLDGAGRVVSTRTYANRVTLDATLLGELKAGTALSDVAAALVADDARDARGYMVYDSAGQPRFMIDALGNVTETRYDALGHATNQLAYLTPLTTTTLTTATLAALRAGTVAVTTVAGWVAAQESSARLTTQVFDAAGRLRYTLTRDSALTEVVSERRYDALGHVMTEIAYATPILSSSSDTVAGVIGALQTAGGLDNATGADIAAQQRTTRFVYDNAGRLRFTIDDGGAVSERLYDGLGQMVEERRYQALIPTSTAATESAVLAALDAAEQALWNTDLSSLPTTATGLNTDMVGQYGNALTYDATNDRLVFQVTNSATTAFPNVYRTQTHTPSENVVYGAELTTGASLSTTYFTFGVENNLTGADYRRTGFQITNGTLYKKELIGTTQLTTTLGTLAVNTTYTIEAHSREGGVDYFVYVKGTDKTTGFRFTVEETDKWDNIRLKMWSYTRPGTDGNPLYIDNLSETVAPSQHTSTRYDAAGRVLSVTDSLGNTESYTYNALGQRVKRTDKLGNEWNYEYDAVGRLVTERSPTVSVSRFDINGVLVVEDKSVVTTTTYDALGNVLSRTENAEATDSNDRRTTTYQYDAVGHQIKTTFPRAWQVNATTGVLEDTLAATDTQVSYDALGRAVVQKDVRGNYSYKVYDQLGRLAYDVDAAGYVTGYSYNAYGEQTGLTRYANRISTSGWVAGTPLTEAQIEAAGRIVPDADNDRTLTIAYDQRGLKTSVVQPAVQLNGSGSYSPTTQFSYDAFGQLIKEAVLLDPTAAAANQWANTYNYYDHLGRKMMSVDAGGYVTAWTYDALGQVVSQAEYARAISLTGISTTTPPSTPAVGDEVIGYDRTTTFTYDGLGRKLSETMLRRFATSVGGGAQRDVVNAYSYDANGHVLTTSTDGVSTSMTYDALGRVSSVTEAARNVAKANAETTLLGSNSASLTSATLYESVSPYTTTSYDAFGNATQVRRYANGWKSGSAVIDTTRDQVSTTRYDRQGRAVIVWQVNGATEANTQATYRNYDAADNVTCIWYTRLGSAAARNQTVKTDVTYDAVGHETSTITTRNISGSPIATDAAEAVAYNAFGEVTSKAAVVADLGDPVKSVNFVFDNAGRLIQSDADGVGVHHYGYNLVGVQTLEWHLSRINGATTATQVNTTQAVDNLGRVTKLVLPSYTAVTTVTATVTRRYDRWGNVIEQIDPRGFATQYAYNDRNQAIRETKPEVAVLSEAGVETWLRPVTEYYYDAVGQLVGTRDANDHLQQTVYDAAGKVTQTIDALGQVTRQAYDALGLNTLTQDALGYLTYRSMDRLGRVMSHGDYLANIAGTGRNKTALETYVLDADGNRLSVANAIDPAQLYDYDSRGLLTRSQSAMGVIKTYEYDAAGRKTRDADATNYQTWGYAYDGRLTTHRDLGGAIYTYNYATDSEQLIGQGGGHSESTSHQVDAWWENDPDLVGSGLFSHVDTTESEFDRITSYYTNGQIKQIDDAAGTLHYRYEYDAAGNRTMEETDTVDGQGKHIWVRTRVTYDAHNRIAVVTTDDLLTGMRTMDVRYDYDAVGNRRRVTAQSGYAQQTPGYVTQPISTANAGPEVAAPIANRNVRMSSTSSFTLSMADYFSDPEQATLSYTVTLADGVTALPNWLIKTYDASTGKMVFTATNPPTLGQTLGVKIVASDGGASTISQTFNLTTVASTGTGPALLSASVPTVVVKQNQSLNLSFDASDYFIDWDVGDNLTLSLVSSNVPGPQATTTAASPDRLWLTGTPTTTGTFTVTFRATDANGNGVNKTVNVQVKAVSAPVAQPIPDQSLLIGQGFVFAPDLSQIFTDANGDSLQVAATLSGGAALPSWMHFAYEPDSIPPRLSLLGQTPATGVSAGQVYTVQMTATDSDGLSATTTIKFTLQTAPTNSLVTGTPISDQSATAGQAWSFTVPLGTFVDTNGDTLAWHGNSLPSWVHFDAMTRVFTGTPPSPGDYYLAVDATDGTRSLGNSMNAIQGFTLHVAPAPVAAPPVVVSGHNDMTVVRGQPILVSDGYFTIYQLAPSFIDPNGGTLTYSARLAGGATWPNWMTFDPATLTIGGTPPSTLTPTTFTVEIVATDNTGLSTADSFTVNVVASTTTADTPVANVHQSWYAYDADNRVTVVNGHLENGQILLGGTGIAPVSSGESASQIGAYFTVPNTTSYGLAYDAIGHAIATYRMSQSTGYDFYGTATNVFNVSQSSYDLRGQLQLVYHERPQALVEGATAYWGSNVSESRTYDAAGRLTESREYFGHSDTFMGLQYGNSEPIGWLHSGSTYSYDADGRVTIQRSYNRAQGWDPATEPAHTMAYESGSDVTLSASPLSLISTSTTSYDNLGRVSQRTYTQNAWDYAPFTVAQSGSAGFTQTFVSAYEAREAYLEKTVTGTSTNSSYRATTSTSTYDSYGRRVEVKEETTVKDYNQTFTNLRYFGYDAEGGILSRRDGQLINGKFDQKSGGYGVDPKNNRHFTYANGQQVASYDELGDVDAMSGLTAYDQGGQDSSATVQHGDTLASMAQRIYGNASMWYVLASANAINDDSQLVAGTTLKVPNVKVAKNDASTFKPYNPEEIIGPTAPRLPYIEKPPGLDCGQTFAIIIATVVRVVSQYFGSAVLYAGGPWCWLGPIIGSVGEFLAQDVEMGAGVRDKYNWGGVAAAGASVAIPNGSGAWAKVGMAAVKAVVNYGVSYTVNRALGEDVHFSWRQVAAQAATAAIMQGISGAIHADGASSSSGGMATATNSTAPFDWTKMAAAIASQTAEGVVTGYVSGKIYSAIAGEDYHFNWRQSLTDAFGNAVGNVVVGAMSGGFRKPDNRQQRIEEEKLQLQMEIAAEEQSRLPSWSGNQTAVGDGATHFHEPETITLAAETGERWSSRTRTYALPETPFLAPEPLPGQTWADTGLTPAMMARYGIQTGGNAGNSHPNLSVALFGFDVTNAYHNFVDFRRGFPVGFNRGVDNFVADGRDAVHWVANEYSNLFSGHVEKMAVGRASQYFVEEMLTGAPNTMRQIDGAQKKYEYYRDNPEQLVLPAAHKIENWWNDTSWWQKGYDTGEFTGENAPTLAVSEAGIGVAAKTAAWGRRLLEFGELDASMSSEVVGGRSGLVAGNAAIDRLSTGEIDGLHAIGLDRQQIVDLLHATNGDLYVFRGTRSTAAIAGGEGSEVVGITPVTIDPLRATIFALGREGMDGVPGSVFFGSKTDLAMDFVKGNTPFGTPTTPLLQLEMEMGAPVRASEFAQRAPFSVSAQDSVRILNDMGLNVQSSVSGDLSNVLRQYPAMTPAQVSEYIRRATNP